MAVIECLRQFLQCEDLPVIGRTPSQKRHEIHHRLRQKSLLYQIFIGRMAAAFGQLVMFFIGDQRTVHIHRNLPAEGLIKPVIFR